MRPKRKFPGNRKSILLVCFFFCFFHATYSQSAEDVVVHIYTEQSFFKGWRLHLAALEQVTDTRQVSVEGQLIGFEGDYLPLSMGEHEIRLSDGPVEAGLESFFLLLSVRKTGITVVKKRLRSETREIITWEDPVIYLGQGSGSFYQVVLKTPILRDIDGAEVAPAMAGFTKHIRMSIKSNPQGSEIYLNNEKLEPLTNIRLSVPYLDGENEKRYLIRNPGLVNCYGAVRLPRTDAKLECNHRDVR